MIEYYCVEVLAKIAPILRKPTDHSGHKSELDSRVNASPSP